MSIYEKWKKAVKENLFFIAPEGFGKTTQLRECYFNIIHNHKLCIPVYIDLADFEITKKDEESIFDYVLNNYFGELSEDCGVNHLKQMLKYKKNYRYVFLIDHFEISIDKNIYPRTKSEILQLIKYETCSVIVASTFYDEATFKSFKCYEFTPFDKENVLDHLKNKITVPFDVNAISEPLFNVLSVPRNLKEFAELVDNRHNIISVLNIKYDYDLIKNKLEYIAVNKSDVNECLMKMAYYCNANNTKYFDNSQLEKLFDPSKQNLSFIDEFKRAFKNKIIVRYKDGKPYVLESKIEQLSRNSKRYGIGVLKQISTDIFCFRFSSQVYIDYYASEYIYRLASKGNWLCLNNYILGDQTSRMLAYRFLDNKNKITNLLETISNYNRYNSNWSDELSFNNSNYIVLTANLVSIMYYFGNTFENIDLSYLDLRLCSFIGKNCCGAWFDNSLLLDECFVPIEPEKANVFAISKNGKYIITGDEKVINIRTQNHNIAFYRIFSDEGNEFVSAKSSDDNSFYINCKDNCIMVQINDGVVTESIKPLNYLEEHSHNLENVSNNILQYGEVCCVENNYAIVKSDKKSYYGNAYLLFNLEAEVLVSYYKINSPITIEAIVQDGDEIEFLFPNDGKPLKSVCYNEKTKEIYYKQYSSMIGRYKKLKNGINVYFDTNDTHSYFKYYFFEKNLPYYNYLKENRNYDILISNAEFTFHNINHIRTKKHNDCLNCLKKNYLMIDGLLFDNEKFGFHNFSVSSKNFLYWKGENSLLNVYSYDDLNVKLVKSLDIEKSKHSVNAIRNINIINEEDPIYGGDMILSNRVVCFDKVTMTISTVFMFQLCFTFEYENVIERFPWKNLINSISSYKDQDNFVEICDEVIKFQIINDFPNISNVELAVSWSKAFGTYISCFIKNRKSTDTDNWENDDFIWGFKNYCFPTDKGIIYYNGKYTCYQDFEFKEVKFVCGYCEDICRNGVHHTPYKEFYVSSCFYKLYDIFKDYKYNRDYAPRIPIYDLNMYGAVLNNVHGLSPVVTNILEKQTEIDTRYQSFENE